jgi:hypothetical protein
VLQHCARLHVCTSARLDVRPTTARAAETLLRCGNVDMARQRESRQGWHDACHGRIYDSDTTVRVKVPLVHLAACSESSRVGSSLQRAHALDQAHQRYRLDRAVAAHYYYYYYCCCYYYYCCCFCYDQETRGRRRGRACGLIGVLRAAWRRALSSPRSSALLPVAPLSVCLLHLDPQFRRHLTLPCAIATRRPHDTATARTVHPPSTRVHVPYRTLTIRPPPPNLQAPKGCGGQTALPDKKTQSPIPHGSCQSVVFRAISLSLDPSEMMRRTFVFRDNSPARRRFQVTARNASKWLGPGSEFHTPSVEPGD